MKLCEELVMEDKFIKQYEIKSTKYSIDGVIYDSGMGLNLNFVYKEKLVKIGLSRPFPCDELSIRQLGKETMDSYVENLSAKEKYDRKLQLHYWHVDEISYKGEKYLMAHGVVSGHHKHNDATYIDTSEVKELTIDKEKGVAIIKTKNSEYYCPLEYCRWRKQDKTPQFLPEYEWIKEKYQGRIEYPTIEDGKILLVISNFDEYYFNSFYYKPEGAKEGLEYYGYPHVGMVQDSYLIECEETGIDIRYYPHYQNIEFYSLRTKGRPLFIENIGDIILYVKSSKGILKLEPGERKELVKENMEKESFVLPTGDLYPAEIIGGN